MSPSPLGKGVGNAMRRMQMLSSSEMGAWLKDGMENGLAEVKACCSCSNSIPLGRRSGTTTHVSTPLLSSELMEASGLAAPVASAFGALPGI